MDFQIRAKSRNQIIIGGSLEVVYDKYLQFKGRGKLFKFKITDSTGKDYTFAEFETLVSEIPDTSVPLVERTDIVPEPDNLDKPLDWNPNKWDKFFTKD